ncbi:MAG: universal stress protein [Chloroflexi bacterium]|nr:universal stress protein [Chloroflexota bacterium]
MVESHGEAQERAHAEADEALQALAAAELPASSPVTQIAWSRHPAERIVKAARELNADVIVMATHSRTGMAHLLDGSVAEAVVHEAPVPVLLIGPGCDRG